MIYNGFHLHVETVSFNSGAHLMDIQFFLGDMKIMDRLEKLNACTRVLHLL